VKYGIYGGGFNPPHVAHVLSVAHVLVMHGLDRVFVSPCWHHAFGKDSELVSWEHRATMCGLAFESLLPQVRVALWEREWRHRYTADLLEIVLPSLHGEPHLIVGSDNWKLREEWKRWDDIEQMLKERGGGVIVLPRQGHPTQESALEPTLPDISSTQVREAVAQGREGELHSWVPFRVLNYIREHQLYGCPK